VLLASSQLKDSSSSLSKDTELCEFEYFGTTQLSICPKDIKPIGDMLFYHCMISIDLWRKRMETKQKFLKTFNDLETFIRVKYAPHEKYNEYSFVKAIDSIFFNRSNLVIASKANYDKIILASKMRNIIVHNHDIAFPSESFTEEFIKLVDRIMSPLQLEHAMIKIKDMKSASLTDGLKEVLQKMKTNHISNIPVFDNGRLVGVFSENTLYNQFCSTGEVVVEANTSLKEIQSALSMNNNPSQYFRYLKRLDNIYQAKEMFMNGFVGEKKLEMIFVTENGKAEEPILGIVTVWDIKEAFA
jgi:hypothetical protein